MAKRADDEDQFIMADEDGNPTTDRSKAVTAERVVRLPNGTMEHTIMAKKGSKAGYPLDPYTGKLRKGVVPEEED